MATPDLGGIADRLFRGFMAPLVVGGAMHPERPLGARVALAVGQERVVADPEILSHVQLARVRCARLIVPLDRLESATEPEWALAASLHDIVQSSHPDFAGAFKKKSPGKLLDMVEACLERVPAATSVGDAVSRHTWFARLFEIARTDTVVSWWVGSRTFLGTDPPERLTAWPEVRRVNIAKTPRPLLELPAYGGHVDMARLSQVLARFLARTPLTDVSTLGRADPPFAWSAEVLALVGTKGGRTLTLRALARSPVLVVDQALGRATRALLAAKAWRAASLALSLLADRAIADASGGTASKVSASGDALFARAAGAVAAREHIARGDVSFSEDERRRLLTALESAARSPAAREVEAALAAGMA